MNTILKKIFLALSIIANALFLSCGPDPDPDPTPQSDVRGCTDRDACNYNSQATVNNGTCEYTSCVGCTDNAACNYDPSATESDSSCEYTTCAGCNDPAAVNYDPAATINDNSCQYTFEFLLQFNFWNDFGNTPNIEFLAAESDDRILFDSQSIQFQTFSDSIWMFFNDLRIIERDDENQTVYSIDSLRAEEFSTLENKFVKDVEFNLLLNQITSIDAVLVLDISNSLGNDFATVKDYAKSFVSFITQQTQDPLVGVVGFASNVYTNQLSNNLAGTNQFIDGLNQEQFTKLYDGIDEGITLLNNSNHGDSKIIITFTDGRDNFSNIATLGSVVDRLENSDTKPIPSFTIGLDGNNSVNRVALDSLAGNAGDSNYPTNVQELSDTFDKFQKAVVNVYQLRYTRSSQPILEVDKQSFRFRIFASPK
ncbi:MAG: VWA domain-containing protein [Reichenbachiella sp.]|uniref:vWA domain-containing protein n=1 Tax=Reichenbachiella sp. TaxID=2184521 RepID=UPI003262D141